MSLARDLNLRGQQARFVEYLERHGKALTGEVAQNCAIGNVSDCAIRANEKLIPLGWKIIAQQPKPLTRNRFGETSLQCEWSLRNVG